MARIFQTHPRNFLLVASLLLAGAVPSSPRAHGQQPTKKASPEESEKNSAQKDGGEAVVVSQAEIARLPAEPTYLDLKKLMGGHAPPGDNGLYHCRAREGGFYLFTFFPTQDVGVRNELHRPRPGTIVAVIRFPSLQKLRELQQGEYIWPQKMTGKRFSGLLVERTVP